MLYLHFRKKNSAGTKSGDNLKTSKHAKFILHKIYFLTHKILRKKILTFKNYSMDSLTILRQIEPSNTKNVINRPISAKNKKPSFFF